MRRGYRTKRAKEPKRAKKTKRPNKSKSKSKSTDSGYKPSVHNSMDKCLKLFKKYKLTNQVKMVKWTNRNHPDHANARGSVQSQTLIDDYKFITGCFANRKKIFQAMKSSKPVKSKSKSKKKKVKGIKGGTRFPPLRGMTIKELLKEEDELSRKKTRLRRNGDVLNLEEESRLREIHTWITSHNSMTPADIYRDHKDSNQIVGTWQEPNRLVRQDMEYRGP